jgi:hypothetical protein
MQRAGSAIDCNAEVRAALRGNFLLERRDYGPLSQKIRSQYINYGLNVVFGNTLSPIRNHAHELFFVFGSRLALSLSEIIKAGGLHPLQQTPVKVEIELKN